MVSKIVIDGREYGSPDEMPPEVRRVYEQVMGKLDADRDGVPDALEPLSGSGGRTHVVQTTTITVNGQAYGSLAEMPEDVRRMYEAAMAKVALRGSGPWLALGGGGEPTPRLGGAADPVGSAFPRTRGVTVSAGGSGRSLWRVALWLLVAGALAWLATRILFG